MTPTFREKAERLAAEYAVEKWGPVVSKTSSYHKEVWRPCRNDYLAGLLAGRKLGLLKGAEVAKKCLDIGYISCIPSELRSLAAEEE